MAPEEGHDDRGYGVKADIWSVGCIMLALLTGKPPHNDLKDNGQVINRVSSTRVNCEPPPPICAAVQLFAEHAAQRRPPYPIDIDNFTRAKWYLDQSFEEDAAQRPGANEVRIADRALGLLTGCAMQLLMGMRERSAQPFEQ